MSETVSEQTRHGVRVEPVAGRRALERFVEMPAPIFADDPNWVPPLRLERLQHLDPRHNPFFAHAEVQLWLAWRGDRCVGRISGQIDSVHLARHGDDAGHFGFLDAVDDPDVFAALTGTVEDWLRGRGMKRVLGPFSLSINDECGLLIDGFDTPPYVMMGHARPYYARHLDALDYAKARDVFAYLLDLDVPADPTAATVVRRLDREPGFRIRPLDMKQFERDIRSAVDIFNDAWSENWGFIPMAEAELRHFAKTLKPLIRPDLVYIAELNGEDIGMLVCVPNLNAAIRDLGGRLLPFGWLKLLWRLKVRGIDSVRTPLMGVRKRFQNTRLGVAVGTALLVERLRSALAQAGARQCELSWELEDNVGIQHLSEWAGARRYKTYRIYAKELASA